MTHEGLVSEISVRISNDEQSFTQKFLCYDVVATARTDEVLLEYVKQAREAFKGPVGDIDIRIKMKWE